MFFTVEQVLTKSKQYLFFKQANGFVLHARAAMINLKSSARASAAVREGLRSMKISHFVLKVIGGGSLVFLLTACPVHTTPLGDGFVVSGNVQNEITNNLADVRVGFAFASENQIIVPSNGQYNTNLGWDGGSPITYYAYGDGSVDEIIFNTIGATPYNDLKNTSFVLTAPGDTVPVTIVAQDVHRVAHRGTVTISDEAGNVITAADITANGSPASTFNLNPSTHYQVTVFDHVAGTGMTEPFAFSTSPVTSGIGALCRLKIFLTYY